MLVCNLFFYIHSTRQQFRKKTLCRLSGRLGGGGGDNPSPASPLPVPPRGGRCLTRLVSAAVAPKGGRQSPFFFFSATAVHAGAATTLPNVDPALHNVDLVSAIANRARKESVAGRCRARCWVTVANMAS
jgi:hypothetical protein